MVGIHYSNPGLVWTMFRINGCGMYRAAEGNFTRRFERILGEWDGTPYMLGQCARGVGTFCTAFVCAILDELYRRPATPLPEIPDDAAMHDPETARAGLRWFLSHYPHDAVPADEETGLRTIQPGDILVTGPHGGGPGHAIIVGPRENTLWQCSGPGVHWTGLGLPDPYVLHEVYRLKNRTEWL